MFASPVSQYNPLPGSATSFFHGDTVMTRPTEKTLAILCGGICLGALLASTVSQLGETVHAQAPKPADAAQTPAAEIEIIKGKLPDQAHAMQDVGYHFSNLWFAARHRHWELANFYWLETRSHLRWAARIIPMRKDNAGNDVNVLAILEAFENGPLKKLEAVIAAKDQSAFDASYRAALEGCYACHKAADKPFIRPQIPTRPETPIINFDPDAAWPQ
jgi:hypothetical protein